MKTTTLKMTVLVITILNGMCMKTNARIIEGNKDKKQDSTVVTLYNGIYQGKNLYFSNPFAPKGGFSIKEVVANSKSSKIVMNTIDASAFEVDLKPLNMKFGDSVKITVKHILGTKPILLNSEAILLPNQNPFVPSFTKISDTKRAYLGVYKGKNIYMNNPFGPSGKGFCIKSITVNGNKLNTSEFNSSAFEINLKALHLNEGDKLKIEMEHYEGCAPKMLNPEVIQ